MNSVVGALSLLGDMCQVDVSLDVTNFSASISACEKGGNWQQVLSLLEQTCKAGRKLECDHVVICIYIYIYSINIYIYL